MDVTPGDETDLTYDLAHEAFQPAPASKPKPAPPVTTATPGYDGDYSYDLAHEIPAPRSA